MLHNLFFSRPVRLAAFAFSILALSLPLACHRGTPGSEARALTVYVVGDGVPPIDTSCDRKFPLNRAQGSAMYRGAKAALEHSERLQAVRPLLTLIGRDDCSNAERARDIAREIQRDESALAVIGHATSETTEAAVGVYARVGLPLLMPIATSPNVMLKVHDQGTSSGRWRNAFRLPGADDRAQAPAVAYLVVNQLESSRIALVEDVSPGAIRYSEPLQRALLPLIPPQSVVQSAIANRQIPNFLEVAFNIKASDPSTIVFIGYGSTAIPFLNALREVYESVQVGERPTIVLTDGCLVPELDTTGFRVFLTFPNSRPRQLVTAEDNQDAEVIRSIENSDSLLGYEVLGYDAMLILGQAVQQCVPMGVSRHCVKASLSSSREFIGIAGAYKFENGENVLSSYEILTSTPDASIIEAPASVVGVDAGTLASVRGAGGVR